MDDIFEQLADAWPSPVVARRDVEKFSGGLLRARNLANLDCAGQGPDERVRVGRSVGYPVRSLVAWMRQRAETIEARRRGPGDAPPPRPARPRNPLATLRRPKDA